MKNSHKFACRVCGNSNNNKIFTAREMMMGTKDEFLYFECAGCKCVQIAEFPDNIAKYYPSDYYSLKKKNNDKQANVSSLFNKYRILATVLPGNGLAGNFINRLFAFRSVQFLQGLVDNESVRILDVGCGTGKKFLVPLFTSGFKNVVGCDPYIEEEQYINSEPLIYKRELSDMQGEWDIITFNHSFEHLNNPLETLYIANKLLRTGGYCIIRIPTVTSYAWHHYGADWFQIDAPRHSFIHSVESIRYLSDKTGFTLASLKYDSTHHQFTISERYKQGKTLKERTYSSLPGRIANVFQKLINALKAAKLNKKNFGDQAIFYLQKN